MPRTHGYAPIGKRCYGTCDWHAKGRTNVIGALLDKLLITVSLFNTNINANIFHAWIVKDLLPKLPDKSVLVVDGASFHKRNDIRDAIEKAGHILEILPAYSPDLNPIEQKWAQVKAIRKQKHYQIDELFKIESFYVA